uniref:Uncharacterized protein n=1 Tax=Timema genevievae TaxID=629358 RepID=A0A7R9PGA9_TIMGE|nr:unnamed protein product [Timema genevievae]
MWSEAPKPMGVQVQNKTRRMSNIRKNCSRFLPQLRGLLSCPNLDTPQTHHRRSLMRNLHTHSRNPTARSCPRYRNHHKFPQELQGWPRRWTLARLPPIAGCQPILAPSWK